MSAPRRRAGPSGRFVDSECVAAVSVALRIQIAQDRAESLLITAVKRHAFELGDPVREFEQFGFGHLLLPKGEAHCLVDVLTMRLAGYIVNIYFANIASTISIRMPIHRITFADMLFPSALYRGPSGASSAPRHGTFV